MTTQEKDLLEAVRKQTEAVQSSYLDYENNPFEAKHVHDLRINIRRMRALLNFLKPTIDPAVYQALQTAFREGARVLNPLRDLDVLLDYCTDFAHKNADLSDDYPALFNYLGILRRREQRKTFNKTNRQHFNELLEASKRLLKDDAIDTTKHWSKYVDKRFVKKQEKLENLVKQVDEMDYEGLHQTRKEAKKLRYAASLLKGISEPADKETIQYAKGLQKELGGKTDAHVLKELLIAISQKAPDEAVQALLDSIQKQISEA